MGIAAVTTLVTVAQLPSGYSVERGYAAGFLFLAGAAVLAGAVALLASPRRRTVS